MQRCWLPLLFLAILPIGCQPKADPFGEAEKSAAQQTARGPTDEFGLPLEITIEVPEAPPEIQEPSPPIEEEPKPP